jgi:hypothetical protein
VRTRHSHLSNLAKPQISQSVTARRKASLVYPLHAFITLISMQHFHFLMFPICHYLRTGFIRNIIGKQTLQHPMICLCYLLIFFIDFARHSTSHISAVLWSFYDLFLSYLSLPPCTIYRVYQKNAHYILCLYLIKTVFKYPKYRVWVLLMGLMDDWIIIP